MNLYYFNLLLKIKNVIIAVVRGLIYACVHLFLDVDFWSKEIRIQRVLI